MHPYLAILALLKEIAGQASLVEEKWGHFKLSGNQYPDLLAKFDALKEKIRALGFNNILSLTLNGNPVALADLELYRNSTSIQTWTIDLNKLPLISKKDPDGWHYNFFLKIQHCADWLQGSNPLAKKHPINEFSPLRIIADDLSDAFGGESLQFLSPENQLIPQLTVAQLQLRAGIKLPDSQALREHTHFITTEEVEVNLAAYLVHGSTNTDIKDIFLYKACQVLSIYLLNEYYSNDKVVIDGIKRVVLKFDDGTASITEDFYNLLLGLVSWIYEDRVSVRKKLFNERLSLDRDESDTLLKALTKNISSAAAQAKERYNFVIIDRKDAYVKELKELLKDIRTQSELYSGKIRTLLSNFLRDLLAAIVLIGFTVFTRFTENTKLLNQELLQYVFYGLAIYYLASILMQSIVDITDIHISKKEVIYWKNATKELLPEREFKQHINKSLRGRQISLRIIYPIIVLCYVAISIACYQYPVIFKRLIASAPVEQLTKPASAETQIIKTPDRAPLPTRGSPVQAPQSLPKAKTDTLYGSHSNPKSTDSL